MKKDKLEKRKKGAVNVHIKGSTGLKYLNSLKFTNIISFKSLKCEDAKSMFKTLLTSKVLKGLHPCSL